MNIDGVENGIVIDHIRPGDSMRLYYLLGLDDLDCSVAIIKNVDSRKYGRKDIIKIDSLIDINLDVLGYIDPGITVNIVKDGKIAEKRHLSLPDEVRDVLKCKNPRCITSTEQELRQMFKLTDRESATYRCVYCDTRAKRKL